MTEPLLQCTRCTRRFAERAAHPAKHGQYKGRLIGPPRCGHPLQYAVYIHPQTGRMLVPYAPTELVGLR
jgi:hypothetical protein